MKINWKLFVEWVTDLKNDPFMRARFQLTLLFTICVIFAQILYLGFLYREFSRISYTFAQENISKQRRDIFIHRASTVARETLFSIQYEDILMLFIIIGMCYVLAGAALQPIKKIIQTQKQFLADTSHELKTPLTIVRTELEVFLRNRDVTQNKGLLRDKHAVESNLEEIERMQQILTNLLTISRLDGVNSNFTFTQQSLYVILTHVMERLKLLARKKHIRMEVIVSNAITVRVDLSKFEQALFNIMNNAIKYTKTGGQVTISASTSPKTVLISVEDTGVGIAKEDLPYIFDRFFRSNALYSKRVTGTGLGLAIAKLIITKHHGKIVVHSDLNKGTTVTLSLPTM